MKEKKTIILAVVLLLLVGVFIYYNQMIEKEAKPTGKAVDITRIDPNFLLKVKVSRAARAYIRDKGKAPGSMNELKGKYLDEKTHRLALAKKIQLKRTGNKAFQIMVPASVTLAKKKAKGKKKAAGATTSADSTTTASLSKTVIAETGWEYDPTGKPDPFKSFILATAVQDETAPKVVRRQLTPLQKMPLSEIEAGLKAIIWGQLGSKALVEDATGKGYVVQEGTYVGQHDGIVKKIYQDRIIVEEYRRDPGKGRLEPNEVVLKLKKVEAEE